MQTPAETESERQQKIDNYLKIASAYFEEDLNLTENVIRERLVDVISSANKILH